MRYLTRSSGRRLAALLRHTGGASAVEFALVALPFFMVLTAVFEAGLVTLAQQGLDNGLDRAARTLFTGTFQTNSDGTPAANRFRAEMCPAVVYIDCSQIKVEVTTGSTFASSSPTSPYNSSTRTANSSFGSKFQCPSANNIVTVRAVATVPRYFKFLTLNGLQLAAGGQMVVSTLVFRAEPYPSGSCGS
ncbi:pilus assembly protein [Methylobacterium sp. C25]|uniref:TadE/TadG family type IV pilus assembly protein n=1 Tax=Methylobacterium sp. C25 TaxID=2721622 RepID=UPI001F28E7AF|nr:TadE/TadG family type IV pilus assembly protein [Methylobacterium sp. C25]MCE4222514.1 pilus assembly protein [Methylobacterium sp. C25]